MILADVGEPESVIEKSTYARAWSPNEELTRKYKLLGNLLENKTSNLVFILQYLSQPYNYFNLFLSLLISIFPAKYPCQCLRPLHRLDTASVK